MAADRKEWNYTNETELDFYGYSVEADKAKRSVTGVATDTKETSIPRIKKKKAKIQEGNLDECLKNKKRTPISKEAKAFLENVFSSKRTPNSKERKIIAEKCRLTPLQVRVWVSIVLFYERVFQFLLTTIVYE